MIFIESCKKKTTLQMYAIWILNIIKFPSLRDIKGL